MNTNPSPQEELPWEVKNVCQNVKSQLWCFDNGYPINSTIKPLPEEVKSGIIHGCVKVGVTLENAERFSLAVEMSQGFVSGLISRHQYPNLKIHDAVAALNQLCSAIDNVESSGAIIPLNDIMGLPSIWDKGELTCPLKKLKRDAMEAIQCVEGIPVKKGRPRLEHRRKLVHTYMILWEEYTHQNATISDNSGFTSVLKTIWLWLIDLHNLEKEESIDFRNDMKWIKRQGK